MKDAIIFTCRLGRAGAATSHYRGLMGVGCQRRRGKRATALEDHGGSDRAAHIAVFAGGNPVMRVNHVSTVHGETGMQESAQ